MVPNLDNLTLGEALSSTSKHLDLAIKTFAAVIVYKERQRIHLPVELKPTMKDVIRGAPQSAFMWSYLSDTASAFPRQTYLHATVCNLSKRC